MSYTASGKENWREKMRLLREQIQYRTPSDYGFTLFVYPTSDNADVEVPFYAVSSEDQQDVALKRIKNLLNE
jgi:hypothetical protein